jgi:hypothetical protein
MSGPPAPVAGSPRPWALHRVIMPQTQMRGWAAPRWSRRYSARVLRADTAPMALLALTGEAP